MGIILGVCVFQIYLESVMIRYVADLMQFPNRVLFWDLEFLQEIHDRESDSLSVF